MRRCQPDKINTGWDILSIPPECVATGIKKFAVGQLSHFTSEAVVNNNIGNRFFSEGETDVGPRVKGVGIGGVERDE